jgi:hypothetical protein
MLCSVHRKEFELKPAGVSKRIGKPYDAFYACPEYGCREKPISQAKGEVVKEAYADQGQINNDRRSFRIERQHSQEMAIRYLELKYKFKKPTDITKLLESVKWLTDKFQDDLNEKN